MKDKTIPFKFDTKTNEIKCNIPNNYILLSLGVDSKGRLCANVMKDSIEDDYEIIEDDYLEVDDVVTFINDLTNNNGDY